ncbi:MAG: hypothetical protein M0D55_16695 [Elusimicrobiota bacterium]|nr:MAG: hypothetical protein M0D55_16695 [Elusimicrobiota bacterium]
MSVSAHLSPEPERRLWLIYESLRNSTDGADFRLGALAALAALEIGLLRPTLWLAVPLAAVLVAAATAFLPVRRLPKTLAYLEEARRKPRVDDNLLLPEDLVKYSHGELIFRFDKYLGGGITATPYYEDLVGRILDHAHMAARKQAILKIACLLAALGQLAVLKLLL